MVENKQQVYQQCVSTRQVVKKNTMNRVGCVGKWQAGKEPTVVGRAQNRSPPPSVCVKCKAGKIKRQMNNVSSTGKGGKARKYAGRHLGWGRVGKLLSVVTPGGRVNVWVMGKWETGVVQMLSRKPNHPATPLQTIYGKRHGKGREGGERGRDLSQHIRTEF